MVGLTTNTDHKKSFDAGSATVEVEVNDLDSQLADLELEVFGEKNEGPVVFEDTGEKTEAPLVVEDIGCSDGQKLPNPPLASLDAVQHALKSISLA